MKSRVHKYCGKKSHICGNDVHRHLQAKTVFGCIRQLHIVQLVVGFVPSWMVPRFRIDLKKLQVSTGLLFLITSGPNLLKWNSPGYPTPCFTRARIISQESLPCEVWKRAKPVNKNKRTDSGVRLLLSSQKNESW
jgi:hypothetical protein